MHTVEVDPTADLDAPRFKKRCETFSVLDDAERQAGRASLCWGFVLMTNTAANQIRVILATEED